MKYTMVPTDTFKHLVLNAGILAKNFTPATGEIAASDIIGATGDGVTFNASVEYLDFADGIDNMPKNVAELKRIDTIDAKMTGTFKTITSDLIKSLVGAAEVSAESANLKKITPRNQLKEADFQDIWYIGDYSDVNEDGSSGGKAGFIAIHLMKALSTGGFQLKSTNKDKGSFPFEYTGHYSNKTPNVVPYEVYLAEGTEDAA